MTQSPSPASRSHSADLTLALSLADAADHITMSRFESSDLRIETKPDLTPVSDADTAVEKELREIIAAQSPGDDVLGEEFGGTATFQGRQWVIDPIDGTKNFVRGVPVWATLIALLEDGKPVVGAVSAPALTRRWWAAEGMGAWRSFSTPAATGADHPIPSAEPRQLQVSGVTAIGDSSVAISSSSSGSATF